MAHRTAKRAFGCVGLVLAFSLSGCGLLPTTEAPLQVRIQNATGTDATIELAEYDFVTNETGEPLMPPRPLPAGGSTSVDMELPNAESWTLLVNGINAVTSLDVANLSRNEPAVGPFYFAVVVRDGGLEVSASRSDPGTTNVPLATPP